MTTISMNVTTLEVRADRHLGGLRPHLAIDVEMTRDSICEAVVEMLGTLTDQQVSEFLMDKFGHLLESDA